MKETVLGLIPLDWDIIKAKDFCDFVTDGTHDTPLPKEEGHYLVTSKNLKNDGLDFENCYFISKEDFISINRRSGVAQYDVLYGMIGTIGNPTIIYQPEIDFAVKNVGLFKMGGNIERSIWLYNFLSSHFYSNYISRMQSGTSQQFVGLGFLRKIPVLVPKTVDNKIDWNRLSKINYSLITVDKTIQATKNSIAKLEKLKTSLMQNLLTGKMKPDGSWRSEDDFWIDDKFGKVPNGWKIEKLKNVASNITMGQSPSSETYNYNNIGLPFVQGNADMGKKHPKIRFNTSDPKKISIKNDLLLTVRAPVGDLYINNLDKISIGRGICALTFSSLELMMFVYYSLYKNNQFIRLQQVTTFTEINQREVKGLILLMPDDENEIKSIQEKITTVVTNIEIKEKKIQSLISLKKSLMQNLLTGKVRIPQEALK